MKKYYLTIFAAIITCGCAPSNWFKEQCDNYAFNWMLRAEKKVVENANADTVYVIWTNAYSNENTTSPNVIWYHKGDNIITYIIRPFHKKKYVFPDTSHCLVNDTIQNYLRKQMPMSGCWGSQGYDILRIYLYGVYAGSVSIDQTCLLRTEQRINSLGYRIKNDIVLLQKNIPNWIIKTYKKIEPD